MTHPDHFLLFGKKSFDRSHSIPIPLNPLSKRSQHLVDDDDCIPTLSKAETPLAQHGNSGSTVVVVPSEALWSSIQDGKKTSYDEREPPPSRAPSPSSSITRPSSPFSFTSEHYDERSGTQSDESPPHSSPTLPIAVYESDEPLGVRKPLQPSKFLDIAGTLSRKVFRKTSGDIRKQTVLAEDPAHIEQDVRWQDKEDMKRRLVSEFSKNGNSRDGKPSLLSSNKNSEDAASGSPSGGTASTNVSDESLFRQIREFSPRHTVAEMMDIILDWVETTPTDLRAKKFEPYKFVVLEMFMNIWDPQGNNGSEKRFLTRREYKRATKRIAKEQSLSATQELLLLNTVQGMDFLTLLCELRNHDLVTNSDVLYAGETLSAHFCEDGYAFGLYTMFKTTAAKICRGEAGERACQIIDDASNALKAKTHGFETLDCHIRLCRFVDENIDDYKRDIDGNVEESEPRPRREFFRRRVHVNYDKIHSLMKEKKSII